MPHPLDQPNHHHPRLRYTTCGSGHRNCRRQSVWVIRAEVMWTGTLKRPRQEYPGEDSRAMRFTTTMMMMGAKGGIPGAIRDQRAAESELPPLL